MSIKNRLKLYLLKRDLAELATEFKFILMPYLLLSGVDFIELF